MRVTLVSPFDPFPHEVAGGDAHVGGVERVYAEIAPRLADRGHDVKLVCSTDGAGGEIHQEGVHVIRRPRATTVFRAPAARLHKAIPPCDLVQTPATYPLTTPPVLRHADDEGIPSVLDFHFEPAPGSLLGRMAASLYEQLGARLYTRADLVLASTRSYADDASLLSRVPHDRIRVVPNGIDPERFTPEGPTRHEGSILFVGRLVRYKGLRTLLRAAALHRGDPPLVVAGDGPLRPSLERRAEQLGLDVTFLGRVDDDELPSLYRGAETTVLPSVNRQEAFGMTLLESMACGTPVVASDLPGVREVAAMGGLTVTPGDARALAEGLEEAADADLATGEELAGSIRHAFDWETIVDEVEHVHQRVLDGDREPPDEPPVRLSTEVR